MANYPAVRAFLRVIEPSARVQDLAAHADAQFDGGEWSAAWHDLAWDRERERVAQAVGARYGLTSGQLLCEVFMVSEMEQRYEMAAAARRREVAAARMLVTRIRWMIWAAQNSRGVLTEAERVAMVVEHIGLTEVEAGVLVRCYLPAGIFRL